GFVSSVKGPRYITHVRRLREVDGALANFFASGIFQLKEKLGPILWQFPPSFKFDPALFEAFLRQLPHDTEAALAIARDCEPRMEGRSYLSVDRKRRMRHAVEIRNASFVDPVFVELLRKYQVALVVADTAGKWPHHEDLTSDFVYIRLHGAEELYTSGYTDAALDEWRRRIESWNAGSQPDDARLISSKKPRRRASRQVYCYFDNDVKVRAPYDARQLLHRLGLDEHLQVSPGKLEGAID
ncbi:MAG TPA: DUF72 domain-containing protein, partial [Pseudomonas sp.]|nr:DUF72 domain-containing protein [Pseudomonas sp.]